MQIRWILTLLIPCFTVLSSLQASPIILDEVMSKEEQKKTGINHLSRQQRLAFEAWLNKTFILKTEAAKTEFAPLSLSINIDRGAKIQLSDNSIWEIDPSDKTVAAAWITPVPIKLGSSKSPDYPYLLINTATGVSVKARHIQNAAPMPAPTPAPASPSPETAEPPAAK